jgi:hypothetical protein
MIDLARRATPVEINPALGIMVALTISAHPETTPMTFLAMWTAYTTKNPHWLNEGVTLTPAGIRKLVEQSYELGRRKGIEESVKAAESDAMESLLSGLFGVRK